MKSHNEMITDASTAQTTSTKVHSELLSILYRQSQYMLWAEAFAASLILFILWWPNTTNHFMLLAWYGYMMAVTFPRYFLANAYARRQPTDVSEINAWEKLIMIMLFVSALGWSFIGSVLLPHNNVLNQALILFLLIGVAATANPFYSPIKKVYATFLVPTLLVTAIALLLRGTNLDLFLGIALMLFGILMLTTAIVSSNLISAALNLRFKNMELAENLMMSNKNLEHMATHDTLTKLANRQYFTVMLSAALHQARIKNTRLCLMYMDVDKFKTINDTLGHDVGDELLIAIAARLKENFDLHGTVFRLGGDEFVVLLENIKELEIIPRLAESSRKLIAQPIPIGANTLHVTTSIGICIYPEDGTSEEALIKHADSAMYASKKSGGNCYRFYNGKKRQANLLDEQTN